MKWLDDHPSQLTIEGISGIYRSLKEGEYGILFRNNHFSTIFKIHGRVYVLATDQGFYGTSATWEVFEMVCNLNCWQSEKHIKQGSYRLMVIMNT